MIYRLRYCNKDGVEARVDIQKGSATPIIDVEGTERPFVLSYNNDKGDKSGMFLSSSADIEIYETTDFNIDNLKTSNETELSVTHYINNVVSWQGFIIPDFFSIEVRSNPVITMTASDRLGTLKNVTLLDLPSMISLRELAILCLNKTGLELTLRTMADFNNGAGINDFFNSKILTQRLSDTKGRSISCYDILSSILTASNSFLVQRSGAWHIINKIQHEAGSGKLYTDATSFINWSDVIFNFSDISIGGRRTIIPVASTVGVFHEFGGGKLHPDNYDFAQGTTGWVASGGYSMTIEDREVKGYSKSGSNWVADFGQTTTKKRLKVQNFLNFPLTNLDTAPYAKATFPLITTNTSSVDISMDMSVVGMPWYRTGVVVLAEKGTTILAFSQSSGKFEPYDPQLASNPGYPDFMINLSLPVQGSAEDKSYYDASTKSIKFSGKLEDSDLTGWNITIRLYGYYSLQLGSRVDFPMFFSFANVSFSNTNEIPKGNIYKTEKSGEFTKTHDIDTSIFADYITYGLNGFFYEYPIDDTSSLYNSANALTTKWTAYNDTEQLPLLQHVTRQRSRLFSVAHDLLSAEIEVNDFDPLAIFVACNKRHTVVSAQFDFFKSNLSVELEEVAFQSASVRDFIYSYFGDGESGIKSIGGISGGGGGGSTGGGLTPEQIEILSFWKKDPDNPDTIFTEMNAYSKLELSAYGAGTGGGGDGGTVVSWGTELDGGIGLTVDGITKALALKSGLDLKQDKLIAGSGITIIGNTISSTATGGGTTVSWGTEANSFIPLTVEGISKTVALQGHTHTKAQVGLGNVDNTSDLSKPISTATQTALNSKLETSIFNTHNNDNVRHITGAERTKWDAVVTDFGNLEIGGRNLLLNSNFKTNSYNGWSNIYGAHQITQSGYLKTYTSVSGAARIEKIFTLSEIGTFTFSIKVKTNVAISWEVWEGLSIKDIKVKLIEDDFEIHSITFTNTDAGSKIIRGYQPNAPIGTTTLIEWEKLEKGTIPTDWTPALEDQVSDWLATDINSFSYIKNKPTLLSQFTDNIGVATHIANKANPHSVTTAQIGAVDLTTNQTIGGVKSFTEGLVLHKNTQDFNALLIKTNSSTGDVTSKIQFTNYYDTARIVAIARPTSTQAGILQLQTKKNTAADEWNEGITIDRVGNVGIGTTNPQYKLDVSGTGRFTGNITTPKVIFNAAGWSMEQVGSELQMKHNNILKMRFTSTGSIVATEEITAFG